MDEECCCQPGCKLLERDSASNANFAAAQPAEVLHDILPTGTDQEGKEVSLEVYLLSKFPDDAVTRRNTLEETYDGTHQQVAHEYLDWYYTKMPGETKRKPDAFELYEHIAGPNCVHYRGYNGHVISAEEMKYCTTMQFIVPYDQEYHDSDDDQQPLHEPDDEDFEREGKYHLTGLSEECGSWEDDCSVYPKRHGCYEVYPMGNGGFDNGDPPFHPHCLEIYRRVSGLRRGTTDMTDLAQWIAHQFDERPDHPAVCRGSEQWWVYRPGDEFLAANPLHVPGLSILLDSARRPQNAFDAKASPFGTGSVASEDFGDLFGRLPEELRDMIVAPLGSKDIASLRLASRSFRHLPYTLWHDLMKKEMPWIWEAWSDRPYPLMACATKQELIRHDQSIQKRLSEASGLQGEQKSIQKELIASEDAEFRKPRPVEQLDRLHTDWHYLYCQLRGEWKNIKGLQNRERVWKAVELVSRRIADPDEDLDFAKQEHAKAFPYQDLNPKGNRR